MIDKRKKHTGPCRSNAEWPRGTLACQDEQVTTDNHASREAADAVCSKLVREGFGGGRKIFPLRVWTSESVEQRKEP